MSTKDAKPLDYVRPEIRALHGYVPGEQPQGQRFIKLNTNENPYPPSPRVVEAARHAAEEGLRLYPDPSAAALRAKAAEVYGVPAERILAGNGSDELLAMIMRTCVGPRDRVAYPVPTYSLYDTLVAIGGGEVVAIPFPADFTLPLEELVEARARVTMVCNPNAPSGTLTPLEQLRELGRRVAGLLVIDEAYVDFAATTALPLIDELDNVLVLRTFSKSFSLAGLRVGLAFGSPGFMAEMAKVKDSYNLNRISMAAATAALGDLETMRANVARIRSTRQRLIAALGELGFAVLPSETNFVLARRPGRDLRSLYEALKERRILVRHFAIDALRDAVRITVGTDDEIDALLATLRQLASDR
jgi:histidinol-phosphate aminotransferase